MEPTTTTTRVTTRQAPRGSTRQSGSVTDAARRYGPTHAGERAAGGVGLLEAEFLASIILLIILLFANSTETYANKIMSVMKRGTMLVFLFFILALVAATGPNAAKIAKGIGALVFVTTLITSPTTTVFQSLDQFIKADWVGSAEHGTDVGSADSGTSSGTLSPAPGAIQRIGDIIGSLLGPLGPAGI